MITNYKTPICISTAVTIYISPKAKNSPYYPFQVCGLKNFNS